MPFWKRKLDPELELAKAETDAALGRGWTICRVDLETYWVPAGKVSTYGISAEGPAGEKALVVAVGEVDAHRQFVRLLRGDLETSDAWAVPVDRLADRQIEPSEMVWDEENPDVVAARRELEQSLPSGWRVFFTDREKYYFKNHYLPVFAASVAGPSGEAELVLGLGEAATYRQLARRLRGELPITDAWAPPLNDLVEH